MEKKVFEFLLHEDGDHFTTAIVKNPAVEKTLMYFDEEKPSYFVNEEKRMIYSVAMQPNKLIFRKATETLPEHYGFFSKESIEKFQENYEKFNGNQKVNIDHTTNKADGVYRVENWIVNDGQIDKTKTLGIDAESGSLIMGFKIENDAIWEQCKSGNLDGLSIEAHLTRKEVSNFKTNINMNTEKTPQNLWDVMKAFFTSDVAETEEEKAARIAKEEADKMDEHTNMPEPVTAEPTAKEAELMQENEALKAKIVELEKTIADAEVEEVKKETNLTTMSSELENLKAEFTKFKNETPAAATIINAPKEVFKAYEEMTNLEKLKFNREN